jgi:DNA-binding GntR family transcriptional regulator
VLAWSNRQHERILAAIRARDGARAAALMSDHVRGTEHVLAGLLPGA